MKFKLVIRASDANVLAAADVIWQSLLWELRLWCRVVRIHSGALYIIELTSREGGSPRLIPPKLAIRGEAAATVLLMRLIKSMEPISEEELRWRWKELVRQLRGQDAAGDVSLVHLNYVDINNLCQESAHEV